MPTVVKLSDAADTICLKVELRCRACLNEEKCLVSVDRPGGSRKATSVFHGRKLWSKLTFVCRRCDYTAADLVKVSDAKESDFEPSLEDLAEQPDPFPMLPRATALARRFAVLNKDLAASESVYLSEAQELS